MLLREIKNIFHLELDPLYPLEEVDSFFFMAVDHYFNLERFVIVMQPNLVMTKDEEQPLFETLSRLKLEEPIQYILGQTQFMELDFKVTPAVLIPRPETEDLVRWILEDINSEFRIQKSELTILDMGTGSGCIAVSLAKALPDAKIYAIDISKKALKIASENAVHNEVEVEFIEADIFDLKIDLNFDIIVSNPPYVSEKEKKEMHKNVLAYEPAEALFVSDENSLVFYEAIASFAKRSLNNEGELYLEINQYLAKETTELLQVQNFSEIELRKDVFGKDRMLRVKPS